jgi:muconate cycloisomerase
MQINTIRIYSVKIPFRRKIKHRLFTRHQTEAVIAVIEDDKRVKGFGEGTPRAYVTGETLDSSLVSAKSIAVGIKNQKWNSIDELNTCFSNLGITELTSVYPAAFCAVELACYDLWARNHAVPLCRLFDGKDKSKQLVYSGVIPYIKSEVELLKFLQLIQNMDLRVVKIKVVDIHSGLSQLKRIREVLGEDVDLRIDANACFTPKEAISFIRQAKPFRLSAVEQPVSKDDLAGLKEVSKASDIPIIADESMYTTKGPEYLIDSDVCHGLNIRLSSCGGIQKSIRLYRHARANDKLCIIGGHVGETAILSLAGRHLAASCPGHHYLEGSFSTLVLEEDIVDEPVAFGYQGHASVTSKPGLGIAIDEKKIIHWSELYSEIV